MEKNFVELENSKKDHYLFSELLEGEWKSICVYGGYTLYDKINKEHDLNLSKLAFIDSVGEGENLVVVNYNEKVVSYTVRNSIMNFSEHTNANNGKCYNMSDAIFYTFHVPWSEHIYSCMKKDIDQGVCRSVNNFNIWGKNIYLQK